MSVLAHICPGQIFIFLPLSDFARAVFQDFCFCRNLPDFPLWSSLVTRIIEVVRSVFDHNQIDCAEPWLAQPVLNFLFRQTLYVFR